VRRSHAAALARAVALASLLLLAPLAAHAAPSEETLIDFVLKWLNLVLLLGVIVYFAKAPVLRFFGERREGVAEELEQAGELLSNAEKRFAEWERKLAGLDAELEQIRAQARERAEAERERILSDAETAVARVRRDADAAMEQELRRSRAALRNEAAELAVELAGRILAEHMTDDDRAQLVDDFVSRVERAPDGPAARS